MQCDAVRVRLPDGYSELRRRSSSVLYSRASRGFPTMCLGYRRQRHLSQCASLSQGPLGRPRLRPATLPRRSEHFKIFTSLGNGRQSVTSFCSESNASACAAIAEPSTSAAERTLIISSQYEQIGHCVSIPAICKFCVPSAIVERDHGIRRIGDREVRFFV
jgi:hypothetical protein